MSLVGNGFTVTDRRTGQRLQVNVVVNGGDDLNFTAATCGDGADTGFIFFNCGEGKGSITLTKPGYQTRVLDVVFPIPTNINYEMEPTSVPALGPLTIEGQFFKQHGQRMTMIDGSDFSLFQRDLDGEDIRPLLAQRQSLGFNCRRVFLLNQSVVGYRNAPHAIDDGIDPRRHPDFYDRLRAFCGLLGAYGQNANLVIFTQTRTLMPFRSDQQKHLDLTAEAVRGLPNVLLSLVNEADQHDNACFDDLTRPGDVLISRGSNGADSVPPRHDAPWDFEEYHTNGLVEWQRKTGHNAMEWADQSGRPCLSTENTRYTDQDASRIHAEDAAEGAALLCAGACYHSTAGKFSRMYEPEASSWVTGAASVPLEFQAGRYIHRQDLEIGDVIRAYERRLSDGRGHVVLIRS